ncbi:type III secretion system chaperone [Diaphorobacter sp. HDW4B]|uniref:type III secretion system chaperone n=1 Tax=Diaphorobacter sp. HDW4B TaxID=2714925 RepID=UPI0014095F43|nr:type III secretion system chaperone [Diaphorobacter sp. HDW4B]QIL70564.1 type III secretion system chaperone [Diaphorobacter sp. HDW4B]
MRSTAPPDTVSANLLQAYAQQLGMAAGDRSINEPLDMNVDDRYRLRLRALPEGGIAIVSRLRTLPDAGKDRDELVLRVSQMALGMMKEHASTCVVDSSERAIWLQQTVATNSTHEIDEAVGEFVNALAFWAKAVNSA